MRKKRISPLFHPEITQLYITIQPNLNLRRFRQSLQITVHLQPDVFVDAGFTLKSRRPLSTNADFYLSLRLTPGFCPGICTMTL